ncbi:hypothetical protein AB0758_49055 [Tolypothrix bouteillei VB521301_2]|uniref:hypothetical protein n=1 Tax=Tolypothrix bouteillei TaxID=1246981 RepID=UPI0038B557B8
MQQHNAIFYCAEIELIEKIPVQTIPDDLMRLLSWKFETSSNQPGTAAKQRKIALPLYLGILSYEVELDTEMALRQAFQPLKRFF